MILMHIECIWHGRLCTSQHRFFVVIREEIEWDGAEAEAFLCLCQCFVMVVLLLLVSTRSSLLPLVVST